MPSIRANGGEIFHRVEGAAEGPVLLLSNSLGADLGMWDAQAPVFASRFRVVRYDSRGHGRSSVPPGPCAIDDLGRDALALLDALKLERVHFCGLSMGGMVGMWLGTHAPGRFEKLVLCNTAARMGPPGPWNERMETVRRSGLEAISGGVLERWFTPGFRARRPEVVEAARKMLLATPAEGYLACCAAIRDQDQLAALSAIRAGTLVITGRHDPATPPAAGQAIAAAIPGARVVELDTAHLSNLEAPEAFSSAVLQFLTS
jgi:3-oxoadipate enol-lactonase